MAVRLPPALAPGLTRTVPHIAATPVLPDMNCHSMLAVVATTALLPPSAVAAPRQDPAYVEALVIEGQVAPYTDVLGDAWI